MPCPADRQNMEKKEEIVPIGQTYGKSLENKG
jgi:hypothetical protein